MTPKSTMGGRSTSSNLGGLSTSTTNGGHCTSNSLGVPSGTTYLGVLGGTKHLGVPRGTKYHSAHHNMGDNEFNDDESSDIPDEYILDLDEDDQNFYSPEEELPSSSKDNILDPLGEEMFSPLNLKHPRSFEWWPQDHVAKFIKK